MTCNGPCAMDTLNPDPFMEQTLGHTQMNTHLVCVYTSCLNKSLLFQLETREQRLRFADASSSSSYSHKEVCFCHAVFLKS